MVDLTNYESLYTQLGRLLADVPPVLSEYKLLATPEVQLWVARGHALVEQVGIGIDGMEYSAAMDMLGYASWQVHWRKILNCLYRAMAHCEAKAPAAIAGRFVPVGSAFDAFTALSKVLGAAVNDVLIVDPYLDEVVLTDFAHVLRPGVPLRLLADASTVKPSLTPAAQRWVSQHGTTHPLEVRVSAPRELHDRAIFVDRSIAWTLTQSLKDFAKRSPAEIVRADDTATLKIAAYEQIWANAQPLR